MIEHAVTPWWSWMAPMLWQVSLLVVIIGCIDLAIRRWAWPQVRHALWLLIFVKLVIPPGFSLPTAVIPRLGDQLVAAVSQRPHLVERDTSATGVAYRSQQAPLPSRVTELDGSPAATDPGSSSISHPRWRLPLFVLWLAGVVVFSGVLMRRMARLARWHREQEERPTVPKWFYDLLVRTSQRLDLERVPAIVFSKEAVTPAVYGVFRPVLLLPAHYTDSLARAEAEHVLLHELAHLKRGDLLVHGAILTLQVLYWFNPFVAVARRQVKHLREICCDLTVASLLEEETMAYRKTLLSTARALLTESVQPSLGLLGVFEEPFKLVTRMRWLERNTWRRHRLMLTSAAFVVILAAPLVLPMAATGSTPTVVEDDTGATLPPREAAERDTGRHGPFVVVRNAFRTEQLVFGFVVDSKQRATSETWIGRDIIAGTERNRTTIVDLARDRLTFIDHDSEVWIESPLPLDVPPLLSEEMQRRWRGIRTTGEVAATRKSDRILGRKCKRFDVTSWSTTGGGMLSNQNSFRVWATTDVPFDLRLLDELLLNLRLMYNRDAAYQEELLKIQGLQMRLELRDGNFFTGKRYIDEVVEISAATPPPDAFTPPRGYRRVDVIERLQL